MFVSMLTPGLWFRKRETELTNPQLGAELLKDPKGSLPVEVFGRYVWQHSRLGPAGGYLPPPPAPDDLKLASVRHEHMKFVIAWCLDPLNPFDPPIDPQQAVDEALELLHSVLFDVSTDQTSEATRATVIRLLRLLQRGSTKSKRDRGQPSTMRHMAVRAYIIRKFNPHPKRPGESTVSWAKLADMLFINDGKCPRKIHDEHGTRICSLTRHQYDSLCVKALTAEVMRFHAAMKHEGIPV